VMLLRALLQSKCSFFHRVAAREVSRDYSFHRRRAGRYVLAYSMLIFY
jgi:hypothetical protein